LLHKGAHVSYHDPFIPETRLDGQGSLHSVALDDSTLSEADCVVIVTDHSGFDYSRVARLSRLIIDARNVTRGLGLPEHENKIIRL
jgi:UDP-N-acetyl-D-glucosamine dehydrogenase